MRRESLRSISEYTLTILSYSKSVISLKMNLQKLTRFCFFELCRIDHYVCVHQEHVSADAGGGSHLKFCMHQVLEDFSSQFRHHTLGLMRSTHRLKHDDEERVFKDSLAHFHASIRTPPGDCAERLLDLRQPVTVVL